MLTFRISNWSDGDLSVISEAVNFTEGTKILVIVLIALLIFLTVAGNILVMLAFMVDKRLRTHSNFFLLNLAICDFLLGAIAIPLYVPYMLTGRWMLGRFLCKLWLVIDYTMCTASAFNVVLISFDRFLCITMAVLYRSLQQRHSLTILKMTVVWIVSFLLYSPAILFWEHFTGDYSMSESFCVAGFYYTWYFLLGASSIGFALPFLSISFFNLSIYWNIKKRNKNKRASSNPQHSEERGADVQPYIISTNIVLSSSDHKQFRSTARKRVKTPVFLRQCLGKRASLSETNIANNRDVYMIKLSKDKKVAKSLAIIVCIFGICWAPYTFLMSIRAACHGYCVDSYWYDITFWLLWVNSAINPVLYPLCHKSFRKAFKKVFLQACLKKDRNKL
ncbi:histamine H3 receptor-like [Spea bombifrons]|uniref:histamine H3 receptor-like n=1 Tax=Spea bombifrons TaxID=233779 RepID=UPI002349D03B|nr:histamine H3 receptor-like [Spea bombifrons]